MDETLRRALERRLGGPLDPEDAAACLARLERCIHADPRAEDAALYARLCRSLPPLRHRLMVVVPVADRPRQLAACIDSLCAAVDDFGHRGRVSLLVVEDSADPDARGRHAALVREAAGRGVEARLLDLGAQADLARAAGASLRDWLGDPGRIERGRKGASLTRNLAMAWLARAGAGDTLYHFIDSDEAFHIGSEGRRVALLDHLRHIDRLFAERDLEVLTGKVVGDPPVSPAVMAGTLLSDLLAMAGRAREAPDAPCSFHERVAAGYASYHDMAALFGLPDPGDARPDCPLSGAHDHRRALEALGPRLAAFFDGVHPTRITRFEPLGVAESVAPARTVYTGNYVLSRAGLRHAIPFANLRLRMAGPTLGRLLRARLGARFAQANVPLAHQRAPRGRSEYRSGVRRDGERVDLSVEYRRQFAGDWMLFTVAGLTELGWPERALDEAAIGDVLDEVESRLLETYRRVRRQVRERALALESLLPSLPVDPAPFRRFLDTLRDNLGETAPAVRLIETPDRRRHWRADLLRALRDLPEAQARWERFVS